MATCSKPLEFKPLCAISDVVNSIGCDLRASRDAGTCAKCSQQIVDRFKATIQNASYHETCLQCAVCATPLVSSCFEKNGHFYCEIHYFQQYSPHHCAGCKVGISPHDTVYKITPNLIFHLECHKCCRCNRAFSTGQQVSVDEHRGLVYCLPIECGFYTHQEATGSSITETLQFYPPTVSTPQIEDQESAAFPLLSVKTDVDDEQSSTPLGDSIGLQNFMFPYDQSGFSYVDVFDEESKFLKRRGPRTTIKQNQLDVLNRIFTTTPKPSKHARAKLAAETGLSMRVWFQNRRSKERRLKHLCNYLRHYEQRGLLTSAVHFARDDVSSEGGDSSSLLPLTMAHSPLALADSMQMGVMAFGLEPDASTDTSSH